MSAYIGDIVFPVLVIVQLMWDWLHRKFRGGVQQVLGALCVGTILNAIVNPRGYSISRVEFIIVLYGMLALLFYWWAWRSRHRN
jgi:hypothetical protein